MLSFHSTGRRNHLSVWCCELIDSMQIHFLQIAITLKLGVRRPSSFPPLAPQVMLIINSPCPENLPCIHHTSFSGCSFSKVAVLSQPRNVPSQTLFLVHPLSPVISFLTSGFDSHTKFLFNILYLHFIASEIHNLAVYITSWVFEIPRLKQNSLTWFPHPCLFL